MNTQERKQEELMGLDHTIQNLRQRKANIKCTELCSTLENLGFEVRNGKQGGHKVFTHDHIEGFFSGSFNCGHGKNPEIKPAYIKKVAAAIEKHKEELADYQLREKRP